ncbi:hypothetical protein ABNX05_04805 [Lysinibacillus sp. M3]|uniref:Uncharacterized protein n=1 Tax=Lysinibacillus zambalensis TaxID=3160866 RepID=A0ABV1MN43_9BACI
MNCYYAYNPLYTPNQCYGYNQLYEVEPKQIAKRINDADAKIEDLKDGFMRYYWTNTERIVPGEHVDFRLITPSNENVISAGYSSNPVTNLFPFQIASISEHNNEIRNVMAVMLANQSRDYLVVDLWVVTKKI